MQREKPTAWATGCAVQIVNFLGMCVALSGGAVTLLLSRDYVLSFLVALVLFGLWVIVMEVAQDAHPLR